MASRLDKEKINNNLAGIHEKIKTSADLRLLDEYRKLFKKEFSFFRRSWAAAWLLMYYDQREIPRPKAKPGRHPERKEATPAPNEEKEGAVNHSLPDGESKLLFISAGRKRRLNRKDLLSFILSKTAVSRDDLGDMRILDNYSFVQVRNEKAEEVIAKLSGIKYRGRPLSVNYAKPKSGAET